MDTAMGVVRRGGRLTVDLDECRMAIARWM